MLLSGSTSGKPKATTMNSQDVAELRIPDFFCDRLACEKSCSILNIRTNGCEESAARGLDVRDEISRERLLALMQELVSHMVRFSNQVAGRVLISQPLLNSDIR